MHSLTRYGHHDQPSLGRRVSPEDAQEFLGIDDRFRENMNLIRQGRNKMEELNRAILAAIEPSQSRAKHYLARRVLQILPESVQRFFPEKVTRFTSENTQGLEAVTVALRLNVNNIQGAVAENIEICREQKKQLDALATTVQKIDEEKWDIPRIQEYLARQSHIAVRPEITGIFNANIGLLSEKDRDAMRQSLLLSLKKDERRGRKLIEVSGVFCSAMVGTFHIALTYLHSHEMVYRHYAVIGESAKDMSNLNNAMFISGAALSQTLETAVEIMEDTVDAFDQAARAQFSSEETQHQLEQAKIRIRSKIDQLLAAAVGQEGLVIDGEVVRGQLPHPSL